MSKKSRKRNKRILATIAALGGAAMLANRRRDNSIAANEAKEAGFDIPLVKDTPEESTFKVQDVKVNVPSKKPVVNLSRMTGAGPNKGDIGQAIRADYAQKQRAIAADKKRNDMMRAIRSTQDIMTAPSTGTIFENSGVENMYQSARKGGRIVKGKKTAVRTGAAKRGFGRAFKGGKK